jgi:hypothetical protein
MDGTNNKMMLSSSLSSSSSAIIPADGNPNTSITSDFSGSKTVEPLQPPPQGSQQQQQHHHRLQCPCYKFTSLAQIETLVGSEDQTLAMIEWLNGSTDRVALQQQQILSCGKRSQCRFRYGTAFVVLQAIRDVCSPYLKENDELPVSDGGGSAAAAAAAPTATVTAPIKGSLVTGQSITSDRLKQANDNSLKDHPAMSNILVPPSKTRGQKSGKGQQDVDGGDDKKQPNILMGRKKSKSKNSTKRRVRPQQIATADTATVIDPNWGNNEKLEPPSSNAHLNDMVSSSSMRKNGTSRMAIANGVNNNKTQAETVTAGDTSASSPHPNFITPASPPPTVTSLFVTPTKGRIHGAPTQSSLVATSPSPSSTTKQLFSAVTDESPQHRQHYLIRDAATTTTYLEEAPKENVERLARIFVSLIENMLVPSTTVEIGGLFQLLSIRLLSSDDRNSMSNGNNSSAMTNSSVEKKKNRVFFSSIFSNANRCVEFAQMVLTTMQNIIRNLPQFIINAILKCRQLQENMPGGLRKTLTDVVDAHKNSLSSFVSISVVEGGNGSSSSDGYAIFTLPFEQNRDSRHNFTTEAEIALFKNREETRDAFISLLRSFMTSKSKGFLPDQVEKSRQDAGRESKAVFSRIHNDNIPWFGQFFVELLLQLGMAPVQEMDQDVLQLAADKDKLQKLHRRLSSSPSSKKPTGYRNNHNHHHNHSTKPFQHGRRSNIHNNTMVNHTEMKGFHENTSTTPFHEALRHFHGYQEFFYVFVLSVDSYNFGMHLSRRMANMSVQLLSNQSAERGLEKRICDLQLLARFLGVLVFSPNWRGSNVDWNKIRPAATLDTLGLLESIGLSLPSLIQASWIRASTLTFVPWVIDLLKLGKWDAFTLSSRAVRQVLANLRQIQYLVTTNEDNAMLHGPSMEIVSFTLESFFNETVTLAKLTSLPQPNLSIGRQLEPQSLDAVQVSLNKKTVVLFSPNMESLFNIISDIGEARPKTTTHSPRKVRPSLIGASQIQVASVLDPETGDVVTTSTRDDDKRSAVQRKLLASFFHQHRDMKDICDFALSTSIKAVTTAVLKDFVALSIRECESTKAAVAMDQTSIMKASEKKLRDRFHRTIAEGVNLFKPPDSHPKVVDMAVRVTVDQGMEACMPRLRSLLDVKSSIVSTTKSNKNDESDDQNNESSLVKKTRPPSPIDTAFLRVIKCMKDTQSDFSSDDVASNKVLIFDVVEKLETMNNTIGLPNEELVRNFFLAIFEFDRTVSPQAVSLLLHKGDDAAELLSMFLHMASLVARHSKCAMIALDKSLAESYAKLVALALPQPLLDQIRQIISQ